MEHWRECSFDRDPVRHASPGRRLRIAADARHDDRTHNRKDKAVVAVDNNSRRLQLHNLAAGRRSSVSEWNIRSRYYAIQLEQSSASSTVGSKKYAVTIRKR